MLNVFDRYIIRKYLSTFLVALGLFTVIIIVIDLSEKIDDFIERDAPMGEIILNYYVNYIPFLLNMFSPVFAFLSVIFFTSKIAAKSEIVALLSSGVSFVRLLRPYLVTSILLAGFSFLLNGWIIPKADKQRVEFENTYIRNLSNDYKKDIIRQISPGVIMSLNSYNYIDSFGYRLSLERYNKDSHRLESKLFAERLTFNHETGSWQIEDYRIREIHPDGSETLETGSAKDTAIRFNPKDFFRRTDDVQAFNMKELDVYIELEKMRGTGQMFFYKTEKYRRYAAPFSIIILTLIAASVSSVKTRGGVGIHIGKGLLISFMFIFMLQFFVSYGSSGTMHPALAVWFPNVIFGGVAFWTYRQAQK